MIILLDLDGVMITTPSWKRPSIKADGFMEFNEKSSFNLSDILEKTSAEIILTSTHRITYTIEKWIEIFNARNIPAKKISKINNVEKLHLMPARAIEILEWVERNKDFERFVIIDDDLSLNGLNASIKKKCVITKPLIGLDEEAKIKVLEILEGN